MAVFKCKMCGGELDLGADKRVAFCAYCGTKQTLPRLDSDRKANLYDRAGYFRRNNEFDKAMGIYELILAEDNTDAESYWSLVLCRYGIEYVEDPATKKKVPTVNRVQFVPVTEDENYKLALQYATPEQREVYIAEATAIEKIQKDILAISKKEQPFDVFICYKDTDGEQRTVDSLLAEEIYHFLTGKGYRVFFSRITLEDKLGAEYEPYIFAALNSAKVMVAVGTKSEYFLSPWVKNEWSRYLGMIKSGEDKTLIPVYKGISPYDLPEEFVLLQGLDMGKIGFLQDLSHGIGKLVNKPSPPKAPEVPVSKVAPLLKRVFMFLEDGDWTSADEYCEKILDIEPENATAYLGKLLSELRLRNQEALKEQAEPFDNNNNYLKAVRFADEALKNTLTGYIEHINVRNETARKDAILAEGKKKMGEEELESYQAAVDLFESIRSWKNAEQMISLCQNRIAEIEADRLEKERLAEIARREAKLRDKRTNTIVITILLSVLAVIAFIAIWNKVIIPSVKYNKAIKLMEDGEYTEAIAAFDALGDYKDAADKARDIRLTKNKEQFKGIIEVGNYITFGAYEQDNNTANGKEEIEWLVLDKQGDKALVVSKYALDCQQYNTSYTYLTWETCTLRKWLNDDFINSAFSEDEKAMIPTVTVSADKNPVYSTNPGNATKDQVFLLSINEANTYFTSDEERKCAPTDYAIAQGARTSDSDTTGGKATCWWLLRSPGLDQGYAAHVFTGGDVNENGNDVNYGSYAVRPALWIDLNS